MGESRFAAVASERLSRRCDARERGAPRRDAMSKTQLSLRCVQLNALRASPEANRGSFQHDRCRPSGTELAQDQEAGAAHVVDEQSGLR